MSQLPTPLAVPRMPAASNAAAGATASRLTRENLLWCTIGALVVALLGLGALLVWGHTAPASSGAPQGLASPTMAPAVNPPAGGSPATREGWADDGPMTRQRPAVVSAPADTMARTAAIPRSPAPTPVQNHATAEAGPAPVVRAPAAPVCSHCGTVESVTPVKHAAPSTGVGMVAGGVLGGVLGNQIGGGNGRTLATVAGAVGGGYVGNQVEKNARSTTSYRVGVRMEDGRLRTVDRASPVAVGTPVTLKGNSLRIAGSHAPELNRPAPRALSYPAPQTTYTGG
ncbi:glycine zipper 2TM domain-containing protein [Ottowia sp.]|uniref:glycine zipper 2TM domain-containing protein n=1 Tax=Ottowia sp. TaxID=1898956 RepID=UPI003C743AA4